MSYNLSIEQGLENAGKMIKSGANAIKLEGCNEHIVNLVKKQLNIFNDLIMSAQKYAEENYPDWENVHAYWNENKKVRSLKR